MIERLDVVERHLLKMKETDDDVGDLHSGVVDIVLNFNSIAGGAQNVDERIANY